MILWAVDVVLRRIAARTARRRCSARPSSLAAALNRRPSGQKAYVDALDVNPIVFGIRARRTPARPTPRMAKAVQALQRKEVDFFILSRPAIEAGERLGFLPGTLNKSRSTRTSRPLYDALNEIVDQDPMPDARHGPFNAPPRRALGLRGR